MSQFYGLFRPLGLGNYEPIRPVFVCDDGRPPMIHGDTMERCAYEALRALAPSLADTPAGRAWCREVGEKGGLAGTYETVCFAILPITYDREKGEYIPGTDAEVTE